MLCAVKATCALHGSRGHSVEGVPDALPVGSDEIGVIVEDANFVDRRCARSDSACARAISSRYWRQLEYEL